MEECVDVFYAFEEEGVLYGDGGYESYNFDVSSGRDLWAEIEYAVFFFAAEDDGKYIWPDWPFMPECTGNVTITISSGGEIILIAVSTGEVSTYDDPTTTLVNSGVWNVRIDNNFDCDLYYRVNINVYGCSTSGTTSGPTGPKGP